MPRLAPVVSASNLSKRFGKKIAVANFDLVLSPGAAIGLLGPNGAGKSTTISMMLGLLQPDSGVVEILGNAVNSQKARRHLGATPQVTSFPEQLTPREVLDYAAARYQLPSDFDRLISAFDLAAIVDRRFHGFSGGELRRVGLALAFVRQPRVVFLDEPTSGLDTDARAAFHDFAREYVNGGGSIVLTSHHWDEVETVCTEIALIDAGEKILSGKLNDIRQRANVNVVSFSLPNGIIPPDWAAATAHANGWRIDTRNSDDLVRRLFSEDVPLTNLSVAPLDLPSLLARIRKEEHSQ